MEKFTAAIELVNVEQRQVKRIWSQFWGAHQRFFKYLCIASKVDRIVDITNKAIEENKSVVIGLQSTGEARTLTKLADENFQLTNFISTAE